jgi:hypothetical protein
MNPRTAKPLLLALLLAFSGLGTSSAQTALSAQDYFDIQQLYALYNLAIDNGDAEAYAATFTPDGVFNTYIGHDGLISFIKAWRDHMGGAARRHVNSNLRLSGDGKEASGQVYLVLLDIAAKPPAIVATGVYTDHLVKTKDGWRFSRRDVKLDAAPAR